MSNIYWHRQNTSWSINLSIRCQQTSELYFSCVRKSIFLFKRRDSFFPILILVLTCATCLFMYLQKATRSGENENVMTFFTRFYYSATTRKFKETPVRLYCICNQPQNPDRLMVQCDRCSDWYVIMCSMLISILYLPWHGMKCTYLICILYCIYFS